MPSAKTIALAALSAASVLSATASAEQCSISPFPQVVYTGQMLPFTITPPEFGSCSTQIAVTTNPTEGTLMSVGNSLLYQAPKYETDDVAQITIKCPATGASCDLLVGFLVSNPETTAPPTTAASAAPTTTAVPTTTLPALGECPAGTGINASVPLNTVFNTALPAKLPNCAGITTYRADTANAKGRVYVNLVGSVLIVGSQFEGLDAFNVVASCDNQRMCNVPINVASYLPLTPPPTSTIAPPPTACPNIYYYEAPIGAVYSSSLRDMPGQPVCSFGRAFTLTAAPPAGSLSLALNGDFTYNPPSSEGWAEFTFEANCMGVVSCVGTARMLVTKKITVLPISTQPATAGPEIPFVSDGYTTCQGTCNEAAWKALPGTALIWDTDARAVGNVATPRKDKVAVGAVGVDFVNGSVVFKGYSQVGNLAARFLTFEPVEDFSNPSKASLASFKAECLAKQPQIGFAEEVWRWTNMANKTGHVGMRYNSGSSYYHKFGGKHIGCDTFANKPCQYAPLVTPNPANWKVDVDGCDVTWTGSYNISSLLAMRNSKFERAFYYTSNNDVQGTIYSQGATARSWLEPSLGVISNTVAHQVSMTFNTAVTVTKKDTTSPFTVDAQYFQYTDANGDKAFGLNLLFFSVTTANGQAFTPDRHVKGFRFVRTEWTGPSADSCPSCKGSATTCAVSTSATESAFTGAFSQGTCANGAGIVTLTKGPSFSEDNCSSYVVTNQVFDRIGFSQPNGCSNAFQNLTIRGVAVGSKNTNTPINFEGKISLQLLLDNGARPLIDVDLSSYVARVAVDQGLDGSLNVCRASPYWPVYDPIGTSLPDKPHRLWKNPSGASSSSNVMCLDQHDMRFGPTSWSVFSLDAPGLAADAITIDSIFVQLPNQEPVYLFYRDPATGLVVEDPTDRLFWKRTHPFLNFRMIANASVMSHAADITISPTTSFGFALTPGAFNVDAPLVVTAIVRSTVLKADGTYTSGAATFRRTIYLDPLLSALTRYGPPTVASTAEAEEANSWANELMMAAAITAGIIVVGLLLLSADKKRDMPKWMPRATILGEIPIIGGVVVTKETKVDSRGNPKLAVYSNPYDAVLGPRYQQ